MNKIVYSVFRYYPSFVSGESINLGVLFYNESENYSSFHHTKKFGRVAAFDDEMNIPFLKLMLSSLKKEFNNPIYSENKIDIDQKTRYYMNEFKFDKPIEINIENNLEETIENIKKIYLRFDYDISERINKSEEIKIIASLLSNRGIEYLKNRNIIGNYNEKIKYDFLMGDIGVKFFSLKNKKSFNTIMCYVKAWAWNSTNIKNIKTVILHDYTDIEENENNLNKIEFDKIKSILSDSAYKFFTVEEALEYFSNYDVQLKI